MHAVCQIEDGPFGLCETAAQLEQWQSFKVFRTGFLADDPASGRESLLSSAALTPAPFRYSGLPMRAKTLQSS